MAAVLGEAAAVWEEAGAGWGEAAGAAVARERAAGDEAAAPGPQLRDGMGEGR